MRQQRGFTLLEILVAMSIFAMIGVASYTVLTQVKRADQRSEHHAEALEQLQRAYILMERDFMQASVRQIRLNEGEPSKHLLWSGPNLFDSDDDGVGLTRVGWHNPFEMLPRGTVQAVSYRLKGETLERVHSLYPDVASGTEPKVRPLLDGVKSLKFHYYDDSQWQDLWEKENALPKAVEVLIETQELGELRWVFMMTGAALESQ